MRIGSWLMIGCSAAASIAALNWPSETGTRTREPAGAAAPLAQSKSPEAVRAPQRQADAKRSGAHLVALPLTADGRPRARNAGMEQALEADEADPAWTAEVDAEARTRLAGDPALQIDALHCSRTFCRIRMTKPIDSAMDWEAVDQALTPIARGETVFAAERDGAQTTGYLYFAAVGSSLPIDQVHEASSRRGDWSP